MLIPSTQPRYGSLPERDEVVEGVKDGYMAFRGLIAHGKGERFDYLIGKATQPFVHRTIEAAAALPTAGRQVISVNGTVAALVPGDVVTLAKAMSALLEVNLFYRTRKREEKIAEVLRRHGDDVIRSMPKFVEAVTRLKSWNRERLLDILRSCDNGGVLADTVSHIAKRLTEIAASLPRRGCVVV